MEGVDNQRMVKSCYELSFLPKSVPYWLPWSLLTAVLVTALFSASRLEDERIHLGTYLFVICFVWMPVPIVYFSRVFERMLISISEIIWEESIDFEYWLSQRATQLLVLRTPGAMLAVFVLFVAELATLASLGPPYESDLINAIFLMSFSVVFVVYAHSAYMAVGAMTVLVDISRRRLHAPFFTPVARQLSPLSNFYNMSALLLTAYHVTFLSCILLGPYPVQPSILVWVSTMAIFPVAYFLIGNHLVHQMISEYKRESVNIVNLQVQHQLDGMVVDRTAEVAAHLQTLMAIQQMLEDINDRPLAVGGAITLFVMVLAGCAQVLVAVSEILR